MNFALAVVGSMVITFLSPAAGGSGVPEVKGFLNGSNIVGAFTVRSMLVKFVGMVLSVASSLMVGPDPLIHTGAMLGGWISQARLGWFASYLGLDQFRNDRDRRDFIMMGTACGVAAIFDSPIGGTLFAADELSSFWRLEITYVVWSKALSLEVGVTDVSFAWLLLCRWQTFLASVVASVTTNGLHSGVTFNEWGTFDASSITFAVGALATYEIWEVIPFIILALGSGLLAALFNHIITSLHRWRRRTFYHLRWARVLEVAIISFATSTVCFWLTYGSGCVDLTSPVSNTVASTSGYSAVPFLCDAATEYNDMASMIFGGQQSAVKRLFTRNTTGFFRLEILFVALVFCFVFLSITVAVSVAGGLIIPLFCVGGIYGRFIGRIVQLLALSSHVDTGVYAVVGAASFMGGVTGLSISVSVIMLEITNDLVLVMPIVIGVLVARTVRGYFIGGLYEEILKFKSIPFIPNEPDPRLDRMRARDLMATNVRSLCRVSKVSDIAFLLADTSHNQFPVTKPNEHGGMSFFCVYACCRFANRRVLICGVVLGRGV